MSADLHRLAAEVDARAQAELDAYHAHWRARLALIRALALYHLPNVVSIDVSVDGEHPWGVDAINVRGWDGTVVNALGNDQPTFDAALALLDGADGLPALSDVVAELPDHGFPWPSSWQNAVTERVGTTTRIVLDRIAALTDTEAAA